MGLETVLARLRTSDIKVAVLGDTSLPGTNVPFCLSKAEWKRGRAADSCEFDRENSKRKIFDFEESAVVRKFTGVKYIRTNKIVCPTARCPVTQHGIIVYSDSNHLSATMSRHLGKKLADYLEPLFELP
ncbi:MAG: hypothetical protein EXR86_11095 [Gammaproteobacteria bacterium]|nr:hypothetical protein [Gammaproteobacteria bacterium]